MLGLAGLQQLDGTASSVGCTENRQGTIITGHLPLTYTGQQQEAPIHCNIASGTTAPEVALTHSLTHSVIPHQSGFLVGM